jgi:hypothetical protein
MMARPVQSFLFAHTPAVVVYDCPARNLPLHCHGL